MAKTDKRFLINMIVIVVLGALSGLFMGNYYVKNFMGGVTADFLPTEAAIRDDVGAVVARCSGKSVTSLSATDNFIMAEYKLSTREYVHKSTKGTVTAVGKKQNLISNKAFVSGEYFGEEISSGVVNLATRYYWVKGAENVSMFDGKVSGTSANYSGAAAQIQTIDTYNSEMGVKADQFINYIVSSKTVKNQNIMALLMVTIRLPLSLTPCWQLKTICIRLERHQEAMSSRNLKRFHLTLKSAMTGRFIQCTAERLIRLLLNFWWSQNNNHRRYDRYIQL